MENYVIVFFLSLALSLLLTFVVRKVMSKLGIFDKPKESRWHHRPVALLGGIAIFVSFISSALLRAKINFEIVIVFLGGGIMFILGLLDDLLGTRPKVKLMVQVLVAFGVMYFGVIGRILPYKWLNVSVTALWIVGLANAVNMIDNMDGLSSGVVSIAGLGIFGLSMQNGETSLALLCLALVGSCLGFLRYNFNPAKIFMGDCGSLFLGYTLAVLAVLSGWQHSSSLIKTFLSPILILSIPIFDTTLVTILRLKNGRMPWQGGKDHSSHRLVSILGGRERTAVLIFYGLGVLSSVLGLMATELSLFLVITITLLWATGLTLFGVRLAKVKCYEIEKETQ